MNGNMSTQTQNDGNEPKTFTQEEVNRMIADRVARVKADKEQEFTEKLAELDKKGLQLQAKEVLMTKGMPDTLLDAINYSDIETFNKNLEIIENYVNEAKKNTKIKGFMPGYSPKVGTEPFSDTDYELRRAMGLTSSASLISK